MPKSVHVFDHPPSVAEAAEAQRSLEALRQRAPVAIGETRAPVSAIAALERVLEALASGAGVAVMPLDAELSTQEAADLLGVSRPTLVKLIETGAIPFRTLASHRRLKAADVLAYRNAREEARRTALDELVAENQRLGLYDD